MQQKRIIIFLITLFIASSAWLFYVSDNFLDPDQNKNWWLISFSNPKSNDLNFVIENHSDKSNFHWELSENNKKITEGDETISKGTSKIITLTEKLASKAVIQVSTGEDDKKEIYKNFAK